MKKLTHLIVFLVASQFANAQCVDTLWQYFDRATAFNIYGISGQGGFVCGTNSITREIGSNFDFGQGKVCGVLIWFGAAQVVGTPDSFNVSVYNTSATDSLPTGAPLAVTKISTVDMDTSTGTAQDMVFVPFNPCVNVNGRFAITVQVGGPGLDDTIGIVATAQGDGLGEGRAFGRIVSGGFNGWLHLYDVWTFSGSAFDADVVILPVVEKTFSASASASVTNACPGQTISLFASIYSCTENISISWSGPGVNNQFNPSTTATIPAGASGNITYSVSVTDLDSNQTINSNTVTVNVRAVNVDAGPDRQVACGDTVNLFATVSGTTGPGTTIQWDNNGPSSQAFNGIFNPGTYCVTVTNNFGCSANDCVVVTTAGVNQTLDFAINVINNIGCVNSPVSFTNTSSSLSSAWNWEWDFGDGQTGFAQDPTHTYTAIGSYTVVLRADSAGCQATPKSRNLTIQICSGVEDVALKDRILLYPNPASDALTLIFREVTSNKGTVEIFDIRGARLIQETLTGMQGEQKVIGLNHLSEGIYFLRATVDDNIVTQKLTIAR
ncbi:MAG: hypothetical protein KatS3mg031_1927 [Chitinophagales bacterium]|nr:MAG: hypothetical protein KatS3mg031_1927 [Chitinophagales bacterium]